MCRYFPTPVICMIVAPSGSFEGMVIVAVLVYWEAGVKETQKVQLLPDLMVSPEQPSLFATRANCPASVPPITVVPIVRSATPFVGVFVTVKMAADFIPIGRVPKSL